MGIWVFERKECEWMKSVEGMRKKRNEKERMKEQWGENSKTKVEEETSHSHFSSQWRREGEEEWGTAEIQRMRINPTSGTKHICGWIASGKTELLMITSSLNMKKWMVSDGKLCSHSVKRKIQNTNTKWRNDICKVSCTISIHISPYYRRGTPSWWRTQTPIKKWKQKNIF